MAWRIWSFTVGLPVGVLAALAATGSPSLLELEIAAAAAGLLLLVCVSILARLRDDEPERGRHLARGASAALLALPALVVTRLGLAPEPWMLGVLVVVALAIALFHTSRVRGSAGGLQGQWVAACAFLALGSLLLIGLAGLIAAFRDGLPAPGDRFAAFIWDVDALVVTRSLPDCESKPSRLTTLHDRGAHPRFDPGGRHLWFDAGAPSGTRQIHRMEIDTRRVVCWTCGEPGNNLRPAPGSSGVVFDTDRWAGTWSSANTELQLITSLGETSGAPSRRLTFSRGRDDHALLGPSGRLIAWSRSDQGGMQLVAATLRSGHGGVVVGSPVRLAHGGATWVAGQAWSPDGRHLLIVRGTPFALGRAITIDPATRERRVIGTDLAPGATASFSADGGWMALAATQRASALGLLPDPLGFLLAALAPVLDGEAARFRMTEVRVGPPGSELMPLDLDGAGAWGEPTGIALDPDGRGFVLAQRRRAAGGLEERLVRMELDCAR